MIPPKTLNRSMTNGLFLGGLFVLALCLRLFALGRYITPDELIWVYRSVQFREALLNGRWLDTVTTGHPGVTTMWLDMIGMSLQMALRPLDTTAYTWITHLAWYIPENVAAYGRLATFLSAGRILVAGVNSLGILGIYILSQRIWGQRTAVLLSLLLALDPFVAGLSGLLHVDSLMATFTTLSLLALLCAINPIIKEENRTLAPQYAFLSGAMASLALLSKTPAILLIPFTGLVGLIALLWPGTKNGRFLAILKQALWWSLAFALCLFLLLPALWVSPSQAVQTITNNANRQLEEALHTVFFMGQLTYDQGPLFYPVVLAFRLSPVVFGGLLFGLALLWRKRSNLALSTLFPPLILGLWSILYLVGITFATKKFDRYALPVIPALTLLAILAWQALPQRWRITPLLLAGQLLMLLSTTPYLLNAYNPLVGGPWLAQKVLTIGWGEGVSAAAHWLAQQPGASQQLALVGIPPAFAPFFPGQSLASDDEFLPQADYLVLTVNGRQLNPAAPIPPGYTLLHTIHFAGLDQAWIYQQLQPHKPAPLTPNLPEPPSFDHRLTLLGVQSHLTGRQWVLETIWQLEQAGHYNLKATLRDSQGAEWGGLETDLVNDTYFYPEFWPPNETPHVRYPISLPAGLPPGAYHVELSLFDSQSQAQLPVRGKDGAFVGVIYTLPTIEIATPIPGTLNPSLPLQASFAGNALQLIGQEPLPASLLSGSSTWVDLYWQTHAPLPALRVALQVGDLPLTGSEPLPVVTDTAQLHTKQALTIPPDLAAGVYPVRLWLLTAVDQPTSDPVTLGQIEVIATDRLFTLPDTIATPLVAHFGDTVTLAGVTVQENTLAPGDTLHLTLYWQTAVQPHLLLTAFVHLLRPDGQNLAQADQWPGGLPSDTWAAGQVIVDEYAIPIPADTPPGAYPLAIGLYTAVDGSRLAATDDNGRPLPDNRFLLPISITVQ